MVSKPHLSLLPDTKSVPEWLETLSAARGRFSSILRETGQNSADGYHHTIREICQQPPTWVKTATQMTAFLPEIRASLAGCERIVLTGSGSSQYAGDCVAPALRKELGIPVTVQGGGALLVGANASVAGEATLVVSLARSGDSPESAAVVEKLLKIEPQTKHLILTCNSKGRLAREFIQNPRVQVVSLSEEVHDRSLVMTSSFTNLALSARYLGWLARPGGFGAMANRLELAARRLLATWPDWLMNFVSGDVERMLFLGDGCQFGAARESALKVLEMTAGKVATMAETYLGLRHGPMCFINERTLIVCFQSADPLIRAYQRDLIAELDTKQLGARKLLTSAHDAVAAPSRASDLAITYEFPDNEPNDADLALLDVMVGQILGFHRCREEGLQPDSPSKSGVIRRVVVEFRIHLPEKTNK
jgi:tagatose-6-phosphate ketose/aldose isomerase